MELSRIKGSLDNLGSWIIRAFNPDLVFVAEIKYSSSHIDRLKCRFDMHSVTVDFKGKSGGLTLLWIKLVDVLLKFIAQFARPWLCVKDFNEILGQSKKSGGPQHHAWQMRKFRSALVDCGFSDLGCSGEPFMWSNRHPYPNTILECLDRAYASGGWSQLFLSNKVSHILMSCSNHKASIIHLKMTQKFSIGRGRLLRFEATWLQSEQYEVVAEANWNQLLISNSSHGLTGWRRKGIGAISIEWKIWKRDSQ
ncbi:UNVERIFIED_CONTAM: hypothetical protein Scaly_2814900 [Sesamum calycinum]|uniref:Non-LTR retroelement reverse transcriptase n=1 Tax=Sesamum calycinum TaxID=2727403 RepID=A0AAW2ISY7_9LAMI